MKINYILRVVFYLPFYFLSSKLPFRSYFSLSRQPIIFKVSTTAFYIVGNETSIGNYNSPGFFNYSYIELRSTSKGVTIGDYTKIGNNFCLISESGISIGDKCLIGNNVKFYDSDFHSLSIERKSANCKKADINIGNNVFIGDNVIVLKGVTIGDNSVIGAGSVLAKDVAANEIFAGNPAKKISNIS